MAVTVADIQNQFPELARTSAATLAAKLRDAETMTAQDYPSTLRDTRVKYLAAELIVQSPGGEFARLDPNKQPDGATSIYQRQRMAIDVSAGAGAMAL